MPSPFDFSHSPMASRTFCWMSGMLPSPMGETLSMRLPPVLACSMSSVTTLEAGRMDIGRGDSV